MQGVECADGFVWKGLASACHDSWQKPQDVPAFAQDGEVVAQISGFSLGE